MELLSWNRYNFVTTMASLRTGVGRLQCLESNHGSVDVLQQQLLQCGCINIFVKNHTARKFILCYKLPQKTSYKAQVLQLYKCCLCDFCLRTWKKKESNKNGLKLKSAISDQPVIKQTADTS